MYLDTGLSLKARYLQKGHAADRVDSHTKHQNVSIFLLTDTVPLPHSSETDLHPPVPSISVACAAV